MDRRETQSYPQPESLDDKKTNKAAEEANARRERLIRIFGHFIEDPTPSFYTRQSLYPQKLTLDDHTVTRITDIL